MSDPIFGRILEGDADTLKRSYDAFNTIEVDLDLMESEQPEPLRTTAQTIGKKVEVSAPGTFWGKEIRTLRLEPTDKEGWWLNRADLPNSQPVKVALSNVWTTGDVVSYIALRSGSTHNYIRLVEHIISLRLGMDIDNLMISFKKSGDPPLFEEGSIDLLDALNEAGRQDSVGTPTYYTVKEKVTICREDGSFLIIEPMEKDRYALDIDCAVDFKTAIGKQRIKFPLNKETFYTGAHARTNTDAMKMIYCRTVGQLFADIRNLGYNKKNVLIAGKKKYLNEAGLKYDGKSLEAVWHRSTLDLLAAVALLDEGYLLGKITSYKAGHFLDVEAMKLLYANDLLVKVETPQN